MDRTAVKPVRLTGLAALRWGWRFARDPLLAARRAFDDFGPFVILAEALPLPRAPDAVLFGRPLVLTAGAAFHAELLSDPATWRGVSVLPGGPRGSAARRISAGLTRLTGAGHAHYRKLLLAPLRRTRVEALTASMARFAETETASWPVGASVDLCDRARRIMQGLSVELLFGGSTEQSRAIAELAGRMMERKWDRGALAVPINLPITIYGQIVREAELLERRILEWVASKRGKIDDRDLASIIVNSPDAAGNPPDDATIVEQLASLLALSSEGSESALIWTLLLLMQHPQVTDALLEELRSKLGGRSPALDRVGELPYLDAVVKESMRVLPPVPIQIRVAQREAAVAGHDLPPGTRVMLSTFLTNRMPELYPDGDAFRPERWRTIAPSAFEYPVFSAGAHICPGYWFGSSAVKVALAAILTRCRLDLPRGIRIDYRAQPTLRPRRPLPVIVRDRDDARSVAVPIAGNIRNLVRFPQ